MHRVEKITHISRHNPCPPPSYEKHAVHSKYNASSRSLLKPNYRQKFAHISATHCSLSVWMGQSVVMVITGTQGTCSLLNLWTTLNNCHCDSAMVTDNVNHVWGTLLTHSPRLSLAQYRLNSAKSWPKTPFMHSLGTLWGIYTVNIAILSNKEASVVQRLSSGLLVNRSIDRSCTRGMIHQNIISLAQVVAQYSLTSAGLWPKTPFIWSTGRAINPAPAHGSY